MQLYKIQAIVVNFVEHLLYFCIDKYAYPFFALQASAFLLQPALQFRPDGTHRLRVENKAYHIYWQARQPGNIFGHPHPAYFYLHGHNHLKHIRSTERPEPIS